MKKIYPHGTDNKPYSNNFNNTTMYNLQEKLEINLITEKLNRSLRPKPANLKAIPISTPNKNLSMQFFDPGREVIRSDNKKRQNNCLPEYVPPYYRPKETGFNNMNHDYIFKRES